MVADVISYGTFVLVAIAAGVIAVRMGRQVVRLRPAGLEVAVVVAFGGLYAWMGIAASASQFVLVGPPLILIGAVWLANGVYAMIHPDWRRRGFWARYPTIANFVIGFDDGRPPKGLALVERMLALVGILGGLAFLAGGVFLLAGGGPG